MKNNRNMALSGDATPEAINTCFDLLMDETLMNITARPEYVHLVCGLTTSMRIAWLVGPLSWNRRPGWALKRGFDV